MESNARAVAGWLRDHLETLVAALADSLPLGGPRGAVEADLRGLVEGVAAAVEFASAGLLDRTLAWHKVRVAALGGDPVRFEQVGTVFADAAAGAGLGPEGLRRLGRLLHNAAVYVRHVPVSLAAESREFAPEGAAARMLAAVLRSDRLAAHAVLAEAGSPADALDRMLEPMLREVGRLWQVGRLSPPEEHLVSHFAHDAMLRLQARLPAVPEGAPVVALLRAYGDEHALGQSFLEIHLRCAGLHPRISMAAEDTSDTVASLRALAPDAVSISCTTASQLRNAAALVAAIRAEPGLAHTYVLLGGGMFVDVPQLATQLGADGGGASGRLAAQVLHARLGAPAATPR